MDLITGDKISFCCSNVGLVCRIGELEKLNDLLADGSPVDNADNRGWYPIHEAAFGNHVQCLAALFDSRGANIDVNWRSHDGGTALLLACQKGHLESIRLLLQHGADPNLGSTDDFRPLLGATKSGNILCVEALLDAGADVLSPYWNKWTPLHEAVSRGDCNIVRLLLARNADPFASDDDSLTPAYVACQYGRPECLQLLVEHVEDKKRLVNGRSNDGASCVYIAAQEGHDSCLDILINNGADINLCTRDNIHPICAAAKRNFTRCAKLMLDRIDKSVVFYSMEDPIFLAVEERHTQMLTLLLEFGFPCNRLSDYFNDFAVPIYRYLQPLLTKTVATPLACAVAKTDLDSVRILLLYNVETTSINWKSYSPLLLAALKRRMPDILREILKSTSKSSLNSCSVDSVCRAPDALLVTVHPLYRGQLTTMLKSGLDPVLRFWCACKKKPGSSSVDAGVAVELSYVFLNELCGVLLPNELADLLRVLLPFSSCGLPNCCRMWEVALGPRITDFANWHRNPPSLTHSCRIAIRKCVSTKQLILDQWVESLPCSPSIKAYLVHNGMA